MYRYVRVCACACFCIEVYVHVCAWGEREESKSWIKTEKASGLMRVARLGGKWLLKVQSTPAIKRSRWTALMAKKRFSTLNTISLSLWSFLLFTVFLDIKDNLCKLLLVCRYPFQNLFFLMLPVPVFVENIQRCRSCAKLTALALLHLNNYI